MNRRRILVWLYSALLAWTICDVALDEARHRGEMIALCDFAALGEKRIELSKPAPAAQAVLRLIAASVGVAPDFGIYAANNVPGVAFAGVKGGKRIIVYDAKLLLWGERSARWRDVCILAHEVGHHLGSHPFLGPKPHDAEDEADYFSGFACALLGASVDQALAMTEIFAEEDSPSHPGREKRRAIITAGWLHGDVLKRTGKVSVPGEGFAQ